MSNHQRIHEVEQALYMNKFDQSQKDSIAQGHFGRPLRRCFNPVSLRMAHCKMIKGINRFPNDIFFYSSKLKEFADDNFKFDENGRKFSNWVENTVGKGEIARYEQFLLFPQCFQETCNEDT